MIARQPDETGTSRRAIAHRLAAALDGKSIRGAARLADVQPETLRRHLEQVPEIVAALARLCEAHGISPTWLLLGQGPRTLQQENEELIRLIESSDVVRLLQELIASSHAAAATLQRMRSGCGEGIAAGERGGSPAVDSEPQVGAIAGHAMSAASPRS